MTLLYEWIRYKKKVAGACLRELITLRSEKVNSKKTPTSLHVTSLYRTLVSKCSDKAVPRREYCNWTWDIWLFPAINPLELWQNLNDEFNTYFCHNFYIQVFFFFNHSLRSKISIQVSLLVQGLPFIFRCRVLCSGDTVRPLVVRRNSTRWYWRFCHQLFWV